jgi:hypothetical protein
MRFYSSAFGYLLIPVNWVEGISEKSREILKADWDIPLAKVFLGLCNLILPEMENRGC